MQPAGFAFDGRRHHQVVVHVQQWPALRVQAVQHASRDQFAVGLGEPQRRIVPRQVGRAFGAALRQPVVSVRAQLFVQDGLAKPAGAAVHQQQELPRAQPERIRRCVVIDRVDLLQLSEMVAAADGAERGIEARAGRCQRRGQLAPGIVERPVEIAEPLFELV
ncbi:hypothetical protein BC350_24645 (plasmid) [Ralstonia pseudosolanacearum]|nr:hypothetical protein BC350_24645 [Ralstonia pseudosolanacearum]